MILNHLLRQFAGLFILAAQPIVNYFMFCQSFEMQTLHQCTYCSETERAASRRRMEESYSEMMDTYKRQQEALSNQPNWVPVKTRNAKEPNELTVTHINQTKDMFVSGLYDLFCVPKILLL